MQKVLKISLSIIAIVFCSKICTAQFFEGSLFGGLCFAQVRGDAMAGYNKPGFSGGIRIAYPISDKDKISIALSFLQKGSRMRYDKYGIGYGNWHLLRANYFELPLLYMREFTIYEKVLNFEVGLSTGYLLGSHIKYFRNDGGTEPTFLRKLDYSLTWGISAQLSEHFDLYFRHGYSMISVDNTEFHTVFSRANIGLINNTAMLGIEYNF